MLHHMSRCSQASHMWLYIWLGTAYPYSEFPHPVHSIACRYIIHMCEHCFFSLWQKELTFAKSYVPLCAGISYEAVYVVGDCIPLFGVAPSSP